VIRGGDESWRGCSGGSAVRAWGAAWERVGAENRQDRPVGRQVLAGGRSWDGEGGQRRGVSVPGKGLPESGDSG
jgi:hypothetical protein